MGNQLDTIKAALEPQFVQYDKVAEAIALGVAGRQNVILWGPAGHGKSEMSEAALKALCASGKEAPYIMSFGEDMDESKLWGGINMGALDKEIAYHPDRSFLPKRFAIFEEMFDAPAYCLLALKDTLTARCLRKGDQTYAMKTETIVACTNRNPAEIEDIGPAAKALIERFPIQLHVDWPRYDSGDYLSMLRKHPEAGRMKNLLSVFAEMVAKATGQGAFISPRTAMKALDVVLAKASLDGRKNVQQADFLALLFVPELKHLAATIQDDIKEHTVRAAAHQRIKDAKKAIDEMLAQAEEAKTPVRCIQTAKKLQKYAQGVHEIRCPDDMVPQRDSMRQSCLDVSRSLIERAVELTNL